MSLHLTWHSRASAISSDLWKRFFPPPFEGLFWYHSIQTGCIAPSEYSYGLLRRGGAVVGLVPAFVFNMPLDLILPPGSGSALKRALARLFGMRTLRIFFIGNVAGEEGHIGLDAGSSLHSVAIDIHDAARARATSLGARLLVWKDFIAEDSVALDQLCLSRGAFRIPSYPGSEIPLFPGGYSSFLRMQTSARRHKIKRKLSMGESVLPVETRLIACPESAELRGLFRLFRQTYERGTTKFEDLSERFFAEIAQAAESQFIVMETTHGAVPVAFMLLLRLGSRVINRFVGIDYDLGANAYLPFRLFAAGYDWAASTGARVLQSGQTGYCAKLDLGHDLVPLFNYCEHSNPLVNLMIGRATKETTWQSLDRSLDAHVRAMGLRSQKRAAC
jgi:hypothetical protein